MPSYGTAPNPFGGLFGYGIMTAPPPGVDVPGPMPMYPPAPPAGIQMAPQTPAPASGPVMVGQNGNADLGTAAGGAGSDFIGSGLLAALGGGSATPSGAAMGGATGGGGFLDSLHNAVVANRQAIGGLGMGLLSKGGMQAGMAGYYKGAELDNQKRKEDEQKAREAKFAQTAQSLVANNPMYAAALAADPSGKTFLSLYQHDQDRNSLSAADAASLKLRERELEAGGKSLPNEYKLWQLSMAGKPPEQQVPFEQWYQQTVGQKNPPQYESKYDAEVGGQLAKDSIEIAKTGAGSAGKLQNLQKLDQIVSSPAFVSGKGADWVGTADSLLSNLGLTSGKTATAQDVYTSLTSKSVLQDLGGKLGTGVSNADVQFMQNIEGGLGQTKGAIRANIMIRQGLARREGEVAQFASQYRKAHGGRLDEGFYGALQDWQERNPIFSPDEQKRIMSTAAADASPIGGGAAPAAVPAGKPNANGSFSYPGGVTIRQVR